MTKTNVHIFIGKFENREDATAYTQERWEPEPESSATEEEFKKWEERNPIWLMRNDLNCYMDSDFIETITDKVKLKYFKGLVNDLQLINKYSELLRIEKSALILIFDLALSENEKNIEMKSTNKMEYIGKFPTMI
jgi:hypothetical protein